jgi:hypothetical protein
MGIYSACRRAGARRLGGQRPWSRRRSSARGLVQLWVLAPRGKLVLVISRCMSFLPQQTLQ